MNDQKFVAGLAIATGVLTTSVFAQDAVPVVADNAVGDIAGRYYASPMFSYTFANKNRETDNGIGGLFAIGKQMNPYANLELYGSYNKYGAKTNGGKDGDLVTGGLAVAGFPFALSEGALGRWLGGAYGLVGVNYAKGSDLPLRTSKYDQNRDGYAFDLGVGYLTRIPFIRFASLRFDVRYRMNFVVNPFASVEINDEANDKPNLNDVVASIGVLIPIGRGKPEAPPPPPPVQIVAAPPPPPPPPPPPCKAPEAGAKLDLSGCGTGDVIVLRGVNFDFDKATLTVNAKTLLDDVVIALQARPDIKVELDGYTDSKGSDAYNQNLSERRAESVVAYLAEHGIDAARLSAKGYGENQPVADNASDEGRELNRRVELRVTESQAAVPPATGADAEDPVTAVSPAVGADVTAVPTPDVPPAAATEAATTTPKP